MSRQATISGQDFEKLEKFVNNEANPVMYLGIDPGKYTGVCGYDTKFYLQFMHVIDEQDTIPFLRCFNNLQKIIYEDYRLFPNKAKDQFYSDMIAPRVIGRIEGFAQTKKVELVKQAPSIKKIGYMWIGQKPPAKSSNRNDPMDAHVHFTYWAVKNGHIKAEHLLKRTEPHS